MTSIYVDYTISLAGVFFVLMLLEIAGKVLFRVPIRTYSRFIGAVVISFVSVLKVRASLKLSQYLGLIFLAVFVWIFLESILLPKKETKDEPDSQHN